MILTNNLTQILKSLSKICFIIDHAVRQSLYKYVIAKELR